MMGQFGGEWSQLRSTDSRLDAAHKQVWILAVATGDKLHPCCFLPRYPGRSRTGLDAGADDYLVKPFELRVISTSPRPCVVQVLATDTNQRLKVADLELDCDNQLAYRQGRVIELSEEASCWNILCAAGQLLTHMQIHNIYGKMMITQ